MNLRMTHPALLRVVAAAVFIAMFVAGPARAQGLGPPKPDITGSSPSSPIAFPGSPLISREPSAMNPFDMLGDAADMIRASREPATSPSPSSSPDRPRGLSSAINILVLLTIISLVPSIMLMTTCFMRIIVVLGLLKQAMGTQTIPPPQVVTGLALFMTMLVMAPTAERVYAEAVVPYQRGEITDHEDLWNRAKQPLRDFMFAQIDATNNWSSVYMVLNYRGVDTSAPEKLTRADVDMVSLVPAYMLSELKTSFLMGFRVYLPFLVIDMVISSLLISMSMMMLPPVLISLPFKILLFVLVDGWQLVVGSLMNSFAQPTPSLASLLLSPFSPNFA
ncbi:MAG: flagellar type III secretion system pore protein FliP [Phycisphaerales bacterium]